MHGHAKDDLSVEVNAFLERDSDGPRIAVTAAYSRV